MPPPANVRQTPQPSVTVNESRDGWPGAGRWTWNVAWVLTFVGTYDVVPWSTDCVPGNVTVAFWVGVVLQETDVAYRGFIACAGLVAASTGALILRRVPMIDLWPLLAITIGLSLVGLSAAFQQLTFAGALRHLHPVAHTQMPKGVSLPSKDNEDVVGYLTVLVPASPASEELPEAFRAAETPAEDEVAVSLHLELALAGSIGFWLTLSMMVGWALNQGPRGHRDDEPEPAAAHNHQTG